MARTASKFAHCLLLFTQTAAAAAPDGGVKPTFVPDSPVYYFGQPQLTQPLYTMVPSCAACPTYQQTTIAHDADRTPWTRASINSTLYTCGQPKPTRSVEYLIIIDGSTKAIRIALFDEPMNKKYGFKANCVVGYEPCTFKWNPLGMSQFTKNIVVFTDEDSDLPTHVENQNSQQQVLGNQFCAMLTQKDYVNEGDPTVFCSSSASIEPAWEGPRALYRGKYTTRLNETVDNIQLLVRVNNEPAVLHPAAQAEVLATARSILRANAMVFLFIRPDNAANPYQPVSSWNSENPLYIGGPTDNKNTAIWQYGDPALGVQASDFKGFNPVATYNNLVMNQLSNSLQALVLGGGGWLRLFDTMDWLADFNKLFSSFKAVAADVDNCHAPPPETDLKMLKTYDVDGNAFDDDDNDDDDANDGRADDNNNDNDDDDDDYDDDHDDGRAGDDDDDDCKAADDDGRADNDCDNDYDYDHDDGRAADNDCDNDYDNHHNNFADSHHVDNYYCTYS
ncbi:hypothetical protein CXG81DRAFT_23680 [Caulochytrium protostelioides]|uniref:Uncharacterized protein n=1 Tax=Caulochytrium protostelioides TaxID=1555241 RepID=A0A4P9XDZ3_9FUNG|nr:hypothetical protein CXG81DRAFT_23680 [Caulochytrium protostelioides]|eukprot:RKP03708.1 hypothetical protein CXG81DRAFT_23680 [Caulochytrium protostelioides]